MREDVEFDADGVRLRGWLYLPDEPRGPMPAIVLAHGFSAVKEMYLDAYAEVFAEAGLVALVFDNRNFGASDGEPRQEIDPWAQVRDYRDAITWVRASVGGAMPSASVCGGRATAAGTCSSWRPSTGVSSVWCAGAVGQRVAQCPAADPRRLHGPDPGDVRRRSGGPLRGQGAGDGAGRYQDPSAPSALPTPDSLEWFTETGRTRAPSWRNEVTLRSVELFTEYEPGV